MKSSGLLRTCRAFAAILLSGLGLTVSAKTVALWPIEWNEGSNCGDFRCRIDPANDFTASSVTADKLSVPGTELPPNPCADVAEEFACNYSSYLAKDDANQKQPHYTSTGAARYVTTTNDFTVEFWFRLDKMPGNGKLFMLAGYNTHNNTSSVSERWFVSLRQNSAGGFYWNLYGYYLTGDKDVDGATLAGDDFIATYSNSWHHAALTFRHNVGGKSVTKLYVDSEVMIDTTSNSVKPVESLKVEPQYLSFGGRKAGNADNRLDGSIDYIRVSDETLEPEEFLNAGTKGWHVRADNTTVAYWPLDVRDGRIDGLSAVGGSPMQMLVKSETKTNDYLQVLVSPDSRKAFDGYPPNLSMTPAVTLDMPNNGCVRNATGRDRNLWADIGGDLSLNGDFTVEGWFLPDRDAPRGTQLLFGTDEGKGKARWHVFLSWDSPGWQVRLYARDDSIELVPDTALTEYGDAMVQDWHGTWQHVALVYRRNGGAHGFGAWTLYLDGVEKNSIENASAPTATYEPAEGFNIGGRFNAENRAFVGCIDSVRACKAALVPAQFLNATEGAQTATNVLAYWPLNVQGDVAVDGRDATGQRTKAISALWDAKQLPSAYADAPVITNPDRSRRAVGARLPVSGSVRFRDKDATAPNNKSSLATFDSETLALFNSDAPLTFEYYYKSFGAGYDWHNFVALVAAPKSGSWTWRSLYNYGPSNTVTRGFYYTEKIWGNQGDKQMAPPTYLTHGTWHHLAYTREIVGGNVEMVVYQDGEKIGEASCAVTRIPPDKATALVLGGRWSSDSSFNGAISSFRVSRGILPPEKFLCATPETPVVRPEVAWSARRVAAKTQQINLGALMAPSYAFTLEAQLPLPEAAPNEEIPLLGSYVEHGSIPSNWCGWKLALTPDGDVKLQAQTAAKMAQFATGTFGCDLSSYYGKRVRLAVVYDRTVGFGEWRLYLNRALVGRVANNCNPATTFLDEGVGVVLPTTLHLGDGLEGTINDCRLTRGVLAADELLEDKGLLLILR